MADNKLLAVLGLNGTPTMTQGQLNTISQSQAAHSNSQPRNAAAQSNSQLHNTLDGLRTSAKNVALQANPSLAAAEQVIQQGGPQKASGMITDKVETQKVAYIGNNGAKAAGTVTPKVTPGTTPGWYTDQGKLYQKMYSDQVKANNAALEKTRTQAQQDTRTQISALNASYQGTNRQLYRDYMNNRRTLPQRLAAQGYSGGLTESGMLRLANAYGESLAENERARHAQETSYNQALSRQLFEAQMKTDAANQQAAQQLYGNQAALREAIWNNTQQRAAAMAAAGDYSEHGSLGFSKSQIRYLREMWKRMNPDLV